MMHPTIMHELAKARHRDLLEEAERHRLVSRLQASQPSMIDRLLEKTGDFLTRTGGRLQERRAPQRTGALASAKE
jgi:hypothetical protein